MKVSYLNKPFLIHQVHAFLSTSYMNELLLSYVS
jgi:hypothetical protein